MIRLVIGLGDRARGDDAAGPEVARQVGKRRPDVRCIEHEREPADLIDLWDGVALAIVIDAAESLGKPGKVLRFGAHDRPLPALHGPTVPTHAFSLADTVEQARTLGRLPKRLIVYTIEGGSFAAGAGLTPQVRDAIPGLVDRILGDLGP